MLKLLLLFNLGAFLQKRQQEPGCRFNLLQRNSKRISAKYIAKWNGTNWDSVGTGMNNRVNALAVYNGELYAGGAFTLAGGTPANHISKWDGTNWSALVPGTNSTVTAMAEYNGDLYAGGRFTLAGGVNANHIAKWNNPTGLVNHSRNDEVSLYPNPVISQLNILSGKKQLTNSQIEITNYLRIEK